MTSGIAELAETAGFTLSPVETALLRSLVEKGIFDGAEYRRDEEGVDVTVEIEHWLPSVWKINEFYGGLAETDWWEFAKLIFDDHARLYTEAPFPTISGTLLGWLLSTKEAVRDLPGITLANIKISGDFSTDCEVHYCIQFTECVFEGRCSLSGYAGGRLGFTGVYAHYINISGEYPAGIGFNDVQCRGLGGRGPGGAFFLNALTSPSLLIYGMFVPNTTLIRDSTVTDVKIMGRILGGHLRAERCEFKDIDVGRTVEERFNPSFSANAINVTHNCILDNFVNVSVGDAAIGADLLIGGLLHPDRSNYYSQDATLRLYGVEVKGTLGVGINPAGRKEQFEERGVHLIFDHVRTYRYDDSREDLNAVRRLEIDGLEYQELRRWDAGDVDDRMRWLRLQPEEPFPFASWRRVAAQLQRRGRFREARHLLIESERRRREALHPGTSARLWSWLLRMSTGYGWELWRIGSLAVLLVILGSIAAWVGIENGLLIPTTNVSASVSFNPVVYSLDAALPIIKLGHASLWIPNGQGLGGRLVQIYFWIHIAMGWVIGTLFVIGFTAIARKADV